MFFLAVTLTKLNHFFQFPFPSKETKRSKTHTHALCTYLLKDFPLACPIPSSSLPFAAISPGFVRAHHSFPFLPVNLFYKKRTSNGQPALKTLIIILSRVDRLQDKHVELFRIAAGTVAPGRAQARFARALIARSTRPTPQQPASSTGRFTHRALLTGGGGSSAPELLIAFRFAFRAVIEVARLKVGRRTGDGGLDRVVRIVPHVRPAGRATAIAAAGRRWPTGTGRRAGPFEQQEAEIVPLVVQVR